MIKPKIKLPVLLLVALTMGVLFVFSFCSSLFTQKQALAATSSTVNFQARLMTHGGAIVPDGTYNVEFKLYNTLTSSGSSQGSCTGDASCLWTETRTGGNRVTVTNGYLTANLGSVTAFPGTINWDQSLYLTMNIGGTGVSAAWDGEMAPRLTLTAVPYAFRAGQLATNTGSFSSTLGFTTPTANDSILLPDASGTVCLQSSSSCGFASSSGAGNYIQNTTSVQSANSYIQNAGSTSADTSVFRFSSGQTGDAIKVLNSAGTASVWEVQPSLVTQTVPLKINPSTLTTFTTPLGTSVSTVINIPLMNPGAHSQILAFGLPSTADVTSRAISVFDARASTSIQPAIALFSPNENDAFGLSWNGTTTIASLETLVGNIALRPGGTNTQLYAAASGGVAIGTNFQSPSYPLDVSGDINTSTQYRIGGTVICTSSGCTPSSGSSNYIQNTTSTQSANMNVQAATSGSVAGVLQANSAGTGDILDLKNGSGVLVGSVGSAGAVMLQDNSLTALKIQNTSNVSALVVDTTDTRVAIGQATAAYTLDVAGDINTTTALRIAGTSVCDTVGSTGCIAKSGSGYYIHNQTTVQSSNLYVQAATSGTVAAVLQANAAGSADILDLKNGSGANVATFGSTGSVLMQNSTNSTNAFTVQTATGGSGINVDTTNNIVSTNGGTQDNLLPWTLATTAAAVPVTVQSSTSYNGYLYSLGGYNGSNTVTTVYYSAQNATTGALGTWNTTTVLPVALTGATAVANNGYMYVMGGTNNSGTIVNTVYYAVINANGTLGAWSTTTVLTKAVTGHTAVANNGYMYVMGGETSTGTINNVYYAVINANGTLGAWTTTSALTNATQAGASVTYNGYLYLMGGSSDVSTVYYTKANSNGTLPAWSTTTSMPGTTNGAAAAVTSTGRVYVVGGYNDATGLDTSASYSAQFNSNGTITSWNTSTNYPTSLEYPGVALSNGYLYVMAGYANNLLTSAVYVAPVSNTGLAVGGSTTITGALDVHNQSTFQSSTNSMSAFQVQNAAGAQMFNVDSVNNTITLNGSNPGAMGPWRTTSSLNTINSFGGAITANGYVYTVGGFGAASQATVQYAPIYTDGTLGTWATTTPLPAARSYVSSAYYNGYIYAVGGTTTAGNTGDVNTLYRARVNSDGTVGAWYADATTLPVAINATGVAISNGFMYLLGGSNAAGAEVTSTYYAPIDSDGTLGAAWTAGPALPAALGNASVETANGNLYFIGGYTGSASVSTIYVSTMNPTTGALSAWATDTTLPTPFANSPTTIANGYLYLYAGSNVYYAQMYSDGTIGSWVTDANTLAFSGGGMGAVTYNGYTYLLGGYSGTATNTVQYSSGARTIIGGSLDLVNLSGGSANTDNLQSSGSVGGTLTAGNTTIIGTLQVQSQANFARDVAINGNLNVGTDDTTTANNLITVTSRGTAGLQLLSDSANTGGEPGGAYVLMAEDGLAGTVSFIGNTQNAGQAPQGGTYTNALANAEILGTMTGNSLQFGTNSIARMTIVGSSGNVCIGSTACTHALGVTGTIAASGSITASTTPDLAETIPAADDVEAADVVMADPNNAERAVKSSSAYNSTVLGVISDGTSSFMINARANDETAQLTGKPMVLAGRVPVKVTNEGGSIKPGDYLTSSSTPGYAMKATKAGPTIGKALGFFDGSTGTVLVLVNVSYYDPTGGLQGTSTDYQDINVAGNATINDLTVSSVTVSGDTALNGDLTVKGMTNVGTITISGHIVTSGDAPQIQLESAAGQNATAILTGNDTSGVIAITPGTQPAADDLIKITFNKAFATAPRIVLTPVGRNSAILGGYVDMADPTDFMVGVVGVPIVGVVYTYNYQVMQ